MVKALSCGAPGEQIWILAFVIGRDKVKVHRNNTTTDTLALTLTLTLTGTESVTESEAKKPRSQKPVQKPVSEPVLNSESVLMNPY